MIKIFLFRHGQTTYNKEERFTGWLNPPLTKLGRKQARKIANILKKKEIKIYFKTTLLRSSQTLDEVLKFHPECKLIITDDRMIERNYGTLNGKTHSEFIKNIGNKLLRLDVEGDAYENLSQKNRKILSNMLGEEEYNLIHRGYATPPPKGESFKQVEKRVKSFMKDIPWRWAMSYSEFVSFSVLVPGSSW